eukprot:1494416-Pyramimonas_sp.AAC.1
MENPGHKNLSDTRKTGWKPCKVYKRASPKYARRWLKAKGNIVNDQVAQTGPLEIWRSAKTIEAMFTRRKHAMGWTIASHGQSGLEDLRL